MTQTEYQSLPVLRSNRKSLVEQYKVGRRVHVDGKNVTDKIVATQRACTRPFGNGTLSLPSFSEELIEKAWRMKRLRPR